jgi:hypothetical protein
VLLASGRQFVVINVIVGCHDSQSSRALRESQGRTFGVNADTRCRIF